MEYKIDAISLINKIDGIIKQRYADCITTSIQENENSHSFTIHSDVSLIILWRFQKKKGNVIIRTESNLPYATDNENITFVSKIMELLESASVHKVSEDICDNSLILVKRIYTDGLEGPEAYTKKIIKETDRFVSALINNRKFITTGDELEIIKGVIEPEDKEDLAQTDSYAMRKDAAQVPKTGENEQNKEIPIASLLDSPFAAPATIVKTMPIKRSKAITSKIEDAKNESGGTEASINKKDAPVAKQGLAVTQDAGDYKIGKSLDKDILTPAYQNGLVKTASTISIDRPAIGATNQQTIDDLKADKPIPSEQLLNGDTQDVLADAQKWFAQLSDIITQLQNKEKYLSEYARTITDEQNQLLSQREQLKVEKDNCEAKLADIAERELQLNELEKQFIDKMEAYKEIEQENIDARSKINELISIIDDKAARVIEVEQHYNEQVAKDAEQIAELNAKITNTVEDAERRVVEERTAAEGKLAELEHTYRQTIQGLQEKIAELSQNQTNNELQTQLAASQDEVARLISELDTLRSNESQLKGSVNTLTHQLDKCTKDLAMSNIGSQTSVLSTLINDGTASGNAFDVNSIDTVILGTERGCQVMIDTKKKVLIFEKTIKKPAAAAGIVSQYNRRDMQSIYYIDGNKLSCKSMCLNTVIEKVKSILESMDAID